MSDDEIDRLLGAARRRFKDANRRVACLESKIGELARAYSEIGRLLGDDPSVLTEGPDGHLSVIGFRSGPELIHPAEQSLLDTLKQHSDAKKDMESAKADWERLDSC